jgi:hypothetical protein
MGGVLGSHSLTGIRSSLINLQQWHVAIVFDDLQSVRVRSHPRRLATRQHSSRSRRDVHKLISSLNVLSVRLDRTRTGASLSQKASTRGAIIAALQKSTTVAQKGITPCTTVSLSVCYRCIVKHVYIIHSYHVWRHQMIERSYRSSHSTSISSHVTAPMRCSPELKI